jgi:hypothetical protein
LKSFKAITTAALFSQAPKEPSGDWRKERQRQAAAWEGIRDSEGQFTQKNPLEQCLQFLLAMFFPVCAKNLSGESVTLQGRSKGRFQTDWITNQS